MAVHHDPYSPFLTSTKIRLVYEFYFSRVAKVCNGVCCGCRIVCSIDYVAKCGPAGSEATSDVLMYALRAVC